ncbi:hypothetical protein ALC56_00602 [Trachymyrmex septentrionalis]|uniref:Uncharacterized protein n=1 Tax=Trachymyrmex septentrionalis TaxID=34720 RepID=A0A195FWB0_9HYME|nr:hypothetical protein ALC56_00602 [Trachymyrmex septentrionalis]
MCKTDSFLQLGDNFALPFNNKHRIFDCIKNIESSTQRIDKKIAITNHSIPILNNIISSPIVTSPMDKLLLKMESDTRIFVSGHPNIIFTHADRGNVTVALNKDAYLNKTTLLSDIDTYALINKDPTKKLTTALRSILTRWKTKNYISDTKYRTVLRVIVSSIGNPLYPLATYLHNILFKSIPKANSYIKNSFELVDKYRRRKIFGISDIRLDEHSMISVSPFNALINKRPNRAPANAMDKVADPVPALALTTSVPAF